MIKKIKQQQKLPRGGKTSRPGQARAGQAGQGRAGQGRAGRNTGTTTHFHTNNEPAQDCKHRETKYGR